jgi:hypothetical protein
MAPLVAEFEARMDLDAIRRAHPVLRSIREDLDHRRES